MADIIYSWYGNTYFNITNKCPCNCAFCIRKKADAVEMQNVSGMIRIPLLKRLKPQLTLMILPVLRRLCSAATASLQMLMII